MLHPVPGKLPLVLASTRPPGLVLGSTSFGAFRLDREPSGGR
jgi:hypothetical protein